MDPMYAAIRKRKLQPTAMGDHTGDHMQDHAGITQADNRDLPDMVSKMTPEQKTHLKALLEKDHGGDQSQNISKGYASSEEQGKIQQKMSQDNSAPQETEDEDTGGDGIDSDAIAKGMLDRSKGPIEGVKPRGLNHRMQQHVASQLKAKGKL